MLNSGGGCLDDVREEAVREEDTHLVHPHVPEILVPLYAVQRLDDARENAQVVRGEVEEDVDGQLGREREE